MASFKFIINVLLIMALIHLISCQQLRPNKKGPQYQRRNRRGPPGGPGMGGPGMGGPGMGGPGRRNGPLRGDVPLGAALRMPQGPNNGPGGPRPNNGPPAPNNGPRGPGIHGPKVPGPGNPGPQVPGPGNHGPPQVPGPGNRGPQVPGPGNHGPQVPGPGNQGPQVPGPGNHGPPFPPQGPLLGEKRGPNMPPQMNRHTNFEEGFQTYNSIDDSEQKYLPAEDEISMQSNGAADEDYFPHDLEKDKVQVISEGGGENMHSIKNQGFATFSAPYSVQSNFDLNMPSSDTEVDKYHSVTKKVHKEHHDNAIDENNQFEETPFSSHVQHLDLNFPSSDLDKENTNHENLLIEQFHTNNNNNFGPNEFHIINEDYEVDPQHDNSIETENHNSDYNHHGDYNGNDFQHQSYSAQHSFSLDHHSPEELPNNGEDSGIHSETFGVKSAFNLGSEGESKSHHTKIRKVTHVEEEEEDEDEGNVQSSSNPIYMGYLSFHLVSLHMVIILMQILNTVISFNTPIN